MIVRFGGVAGAHLRIDESQKIWPVWYATFPDHDLEEGFRNAHRKFSRITEKRIGMAISDMGRLIVFFGFFAFVGIVFAFALAAITAQREYRRAVTRLNPLGCTAAAFAFLLLVALARNCAGGLIRLSRSGAVPMTHLRERTGRQNLFAWQPGVLRCCNLDVELMA